VLHNNSVVMRVVAMVVVMVLLMNDNGWLLLNDNFIGTHYGCERNKGSENQNCFHAVQSPATLKADVLAVGFAVTGTAPVSAAGS
jgi:hypothetical protein